MGYGVSVGDYVWGLPGRVSTRQRASAAFALYGWPLGELAPAEAERDAPSTPMNRVAFGRFSMTEATIGLLVGVFLIWYLARLAPEG